MSQHATRLQTCCGLARLCGLINEERVGHIRCRLHVVYETFYMYRNLLLNRRFSPRLTCVQICRAKEPWSECTGIHVRNLKPLCRFVVFVRIIINPLRHHICICHHQNQHSIEHEFASMPVFTHSALTHYTNWPIPPACSSLHQPG